MRGRGMRWEFVAHVSNTESGEEWVEVVGGKTGERSVRSFPPDRLFPLGGGSLGGKRQGAPSGASFLDAPRLPLG